MEMKDDSEISLFSLELVVEKVYIPHTPCRFPAIAFRLLDFPTIVIKHVEDDLSKAIQSKISFDPYYHLPDQFMELKDRHGNFMVKKGKSCLFKISANSLKQHLASTPLYVMVIDLFPEVPKLVGNSSVPLNSLMESICVDIAKLGSTVPSVHGDKGLFKLYNLMGKEIGYFVLGFRLLCLGPSFIAHLPDTALLHHKQKVQEDQNVDHIITKHQNLLLGDKTTVDIPDRQQKTTSSMTDPMKQDAFLQTVEMKDKEILVNLYENGSSVVENKDVKNESHNVTTQTDKQKRRKEHQRAIPVPKWVEQIEHENDDNDLMINNIVCPPPMFYNSEASPALIVKRNISKVLYDAELPANDLSEIESFDGYGLHTEKLAKEKIINQRTSKSIQSVKFQPSTIGKVLEPAVPRARPGEHVLGLQVAPNLDAVFPLLTALFNELSSIQNPKLLLNVSNKLQAATLKSSELTSSPDKKTEIQPEDKKLSSSVVSAVAAALTRKLEISKENIQRGNSEQVKKEHSPLFQQHHQSPLKGQKSVADKENKKNNKKQNLVPPAAKGKLVFGMTHTQRLRLQKTNPQWLKLAEKEATDLKAKTQTMKKTTDIDDMNATTFSDTLTEVRRLAEKELNSTVGGDTLLNLASELKSTAEKDKIMQQKGVHHKSNPQVTKKGRSEKFSEHKIDQNLISKSQQLKARNRLRQKRKLHQKGLRKELSNDAMNRQKSPLAQNTDYDDQLSVLSDVLSSRSRSIEVRLPSAEPDLDDTTTSLSDKGDEDDDIEEEDIPLPDDSSKERPRSNIINFPRYVSKDVSLPESIDGVHNASLNISETVENNSPLESTRQSKSCTSDQNDSKVLQSTDYDTRQFHSTDEIELQGLISEEANISDAPDSGRRSVSLVANSQKFPVINPQLSENSPVPSIRRSTTKIDPLAYSHLHSGSFSKDRNQLPSPRPSTPKGTIVKGELPEKAYFKPQDSGLTTPKLKTTPRSLSSSPKHPTPRPRRPMRESIHTDSLSSYMPSDPDNVIVSLSSNSGNYSDDFSAIHSGESANSSAEQFPKIISSAKLGYTIN
ncbi:unnamed protein product [Lymnaea stagnalis]|uniref:Microtubule-associated protein 10 n=1 Tax=Lymnaea stagnalis TaxID=6523 RepID=A0AAV2H0F0_LYMST